MSGCIFFCAKGVVLQNANRSLKLNSFVQEGLLFARPRIFDPQSSSNLTLPPDLRSQIMDRKVWRPRFQLLPITRPGRPFCKISPNSPGCPWASLFRGGGAFMHRSWDLRGFYAVGQHQFNPSAPSHFADITTIMV